MIKTITLKGKRVKCRRIDSGHSKPGDIVTSPEGYYEPFITEDPGHVIDSVARRGGQGVYYRPIKSRPLKRTRKKGTAGVKSVEAWVTHYWLHNPSKMYQGIISLDENAASDLTPVTITLGHAKKGGRK